MSDNYIAVPDSLVESILDIVEKYDLYDELPEDVQEAIDFWNNKLDRNE